MRWRDVLAGIVATGITSALPAAEQNKVYRLAIFTLVSIPRNDLAFAPLVSRLRGLGYIEGKNLIVARYTADGLPERYAEIARSIVRTKPDVIVALNHQAIALLAKETSTSQLSR
ncbi:ABC-type uncharacterized transport system substrate-binding protein [Bradyrhizobium sp. USDA 4463]